MSAYTLFNNKNRIPVPLPPYSGCYGVKMLKDSANIMQVSIIGL